MTEKTKAVNLTEDEISTLIAYRGAKLSTSRGAKLSTRDFSDEDVDRINYLNKRLKAFKEPETETEKQNTKADNITQGWGTGA